MCGEDSQQAPCQFQLALHRLIRIRIYTERDWLAGIFRMRQFAQQALRRVRFVEQPAFKILAGG